MTTGLYTITKIGTGSGPFDHTCKMTMAKGDSPEDAFDRQIEALPHSYDLGTYVVAFAGDAYEAPGGVHRAIGVFRRSERPAIVTEEVTSL